MFAALLLAFGLGFVYFIAAIPAAVAAGLPWPLAVLGAWAGYSAGALVVTMAGAPLRAWLARKLPLPTPNPEKRFWRIWQRAGLPGLGLIAPITVGPQVAALLAVAAGSPAGRVTVALSLGALPWCALLALLTHFGVRWSGLGG